VGDIVRLEEEDPLPADILVLSSSDEFHRCQITTANLDGESNLKVSGKRISVNILRVHVIEFQFCLCADTLLSSGITRFENSIRRSKPECSDGM